MSDETEKASEEKAEAVGPAAHLSADRPIQSIKQDLLGRGGFALGFANALSSWRGDESLVLALYGPWGSGKTSVKNLILELLAKAERPLSIVEFNPWSWSGQDAIMSAFLREVGLAIGHQAKGEEKAQVVKKWNRYASRLALGGTVIKYVKTATGILGVPVLPTVLDALGEATDKSTDLLKTAGETQESDAEEPLDRLKESLAESLKKLEQPVLVVLDDVDRLTSDEIRLLFRLVKANADFPNVIFLLLFERAIVENALKDVAGSNARAYLEKIVQAGFDLPEVARSDVDHVFTAGLEQCLAAFPGWERRFDADRWPKTFQLIAPFLETIRDVRRFLSSFSFIAGLFFSGGVLEVNVVDLIGVEVLRIFEPDVYRRIPDDRDLLIRSIAFSYGGRDDGKERKAGIEALLERASNVRRDAVRRLLGELFPTIDRNFGPGFEEEWLRCLRVCSRQIFPRYFVLTVPEGDVPQSLIDTVVAVSADADAIGKLLKLLRANGSLVSVLNRLEAYSAVMDLAVAENFITALWDNGDDLPDGGVGMFDFGPTMTAHRIVFHWLKREPDLKIRGRILLNALRRTTGLHLPVDRVAIEMQRDKKGEVDLDRSLFDEMDLKTAVSLSLEKIEAAAKDGRILNSKLGFYLWRWKQWTDNGHATAYAMALTSTLPGALLFLRGFMQEIRSTSLGSGVTKGQWVIRLKNLEVFVNPESLKATLAPVMGESVPSEYADYVKAFETEIIAFRRALDRRAKGKPDDSDFPDDDDE